MRLEAVWSLAGTQDSALATHDFPPGERMHVLGDYNNTRYNTPTESFCSGSLVDGQYTSGDCQYVPNCNFTGFQGKSGWWPEVLENGSGISQSIGTVSREWYCTGQTNRVRAVPAPCPQCPGEVLSVGGTVARNEGNDLLPCGATLYVHQVGTVTVVDAGGGLALNQLDHYAGASGCNKTAGTIGVRKVIKLW